MYKIFVNDTPLLLISELPAGKNGNYYTQDKHILKVYKDTGDINEALISLYNTTKSIESYTIISHDIERVKEELGQYFKVIQAAGGVIRNNNKELLFIYRLDKWDLPKGKLEPEEDLVDAAIREVKEETGISTLTEIKKLTTTYHVYTAGESKCLKETYWFSMLHDTNELLVPQAQENITEAKWMTESDIDNLVLPNTYPNIRDLVKFQRQLQY